MRQLPDWKSLPDWKNCEDRLFNETINALKRFAEEFPDTAIWNLAFDSSPYYGDVLISFDTIQNSLTDIVEKEAEETAKWKRILSKGDDWRAGEEMENSHILETFANNPRIDCFLYSYLKFNNNTGDFSHSDYASINFNEWQIVAEEGRKLEPQDDEYCSDEYLEANAAIMFWKVIDRLIVGKHLEIVKRSPLFFLGYTFHDEDPVILRMLVQ